MVSVPLRVLERALTKAYMLYEGQLAENGQTKATRTNVGSSSRPWLSTRGTTRGPKWLIASRIALC